MLIYIEKRNPNESNSHCINKIAYKIHQQTIFTERIELHSFFLTNDWLSRLMRRFTCNVTISSWYLL